MFCRPANSLFSGKNQEFGIMLNTIGRTDSRRGRFNSFHSVRGGPGTRTVRRTLVEKPIH